MKSGFGTAIKLGVLFLFCLFFVGCREGKEQKNIQGGQNAIEQLNNRGSLPPAASYLGEIPLYEKFSEIEPLFHIDNDTTYVINFWATWCKPCIEELPYLEEVNARYREEKVKVVLCSLDFPKQLESKLLPFLEENQLKSEVVVLLDGKYNDWIDKVSGEWSGAIPATYIHRGGVHRFIGKPVTSAEELTKVINSL